jgi:hypothetical protein
VSKTPKNNSGRPERTWRLIKGSLSDYRADWLTYVKVTAVVAVPFNLLTLAGFSSVDVQALGSYGTFASIIMNVALLWTVLELQAGRRPNLPRAYYTGTGNLVSYILTSALLVVMLVPLAFGLILYSAASAQDTGATLPELLLVGGVAVVLALPSIYAMVRFGLGLMLVMTDDLRPMAALRAARLLTLGHFWPLTGRLVLMGLFLILLTIPVALVAVGLSFIRLDNWAAAVFQIVATLTILPIAYLYLLRIVRSLQPARAAD